MDLIQRARELRPIIDAHAFRTEELGHLSPEVDAALRSAQLYWMGVPVELGGLGVDLVTMMRVIEEVSAADGSTGWVMFVHAFLTQAVAIYCGDSALTEIFKKSEMPIVSGMLAPVGRCNAKDGGYLGSGRFAFASGANEASWFLAGMTIADEAKASSSAESLVAVVPRERVEVIPNWDTIGLRGTASWDYNLQLQAIGPAFVFSRTAVEPLRGGPSGRFGVVGLAEAGHIAIPLEGVMHLAQGQRLV